MFDTACRDRDPSESEIVPLWVYTSADGAKIERHIPALPSSREVGQASALKRSLVLYRLAFGQPRQEDLLEYLADQMDPEDLERLVPGTANRPQPTCIERAGTVGDDVR